MRRPLAKIRGARLVPQRRIVGPVSWVIAIMIALMVLTAAGGVSLSKLTHRASSELSGAVTVQLVEANAALRQQQAQRAAAILVGDPAVASVRIVPREELEALLEPWLGSVEGAEAVPIPALVDVQLRREADQAEVERLHALVKGSVPSARIDAQSSLLQPVYSALSALRYLALGLVVLLSLTSIAAVWLAARNAFTGHRETVEIMHLLGSTDEQIASLFQRTVGTDAAMGGAVGFALGSGAVWLIGTQFAALDSGLVAGGGFGPYEWATLAFIPVGGVVLAILTARITVLRALRRML